VARPRLLLAVVVLLTVASLSSCGGGGEGAEAGREASAVHGQIERSRLFALQRQLKLILGNEGDDELVVDSIRLESALFEQVDAQGRRSVIAPGDDVSIPLDFGAPVCGEDADDDSVAVLGIDGEQVRLPLQQHPETTLTDLNARECETERIAEAAELGFSEQVTETAPFTAETSLDLELGEDDATVTVDEIRSSVVFSLAPAGDDVPLLEVGPAVRRDSVAVTVAASRCDGHALTESKKTFFFAAWIHLDGGAAVRVEVEARGALRETLEAFLEQCLATPGGVPS
jgi:hypothetical protein